MNSKNEFFILQIIKYAPPIFIVTLSIIISITLYINKQKTFQEEKNSIEQEFIQNNKDHIKDEVNNIYEYILTQQKNTEDKLKQSLKSRVYEAYNIAKNIYEQNKNEPKKIVAKRIKDALRTIRFNNGRGYFFIYSFDYECILFPLNESIEGKNFYNFKEGKGKYLTRNIISQVKKEQEGFMKWWFHKPSDLKKQYEKLGFNKHFEPYDWFIGTGEYIEDFEKDVKQNVINHIQSLKFPNNGYIFTLDYKGNYLTHIKKNIIGLNALEVKDTRKHKTVFDTISIAKNKGQGYISYVQNKKPGTNIPVRKTSYIRGINNWEIFIGKGFYEDDTNVIVEKKKDILDQRLQNVINKLIVTSIILTTLLLFISLYISKLLEKRFKIYKQEIKSNLEEITKQHNILAQQSKMAAIGEMIANIAHQWRQPLSLISTASTGLKLKKEIGQLDDKDFNESLDYINNSTQYLSKTIDDFRNFFSADITAEDFSVNNAINDALKIVEVQFKNKDISIIKNIKDFKIYGIKNELMQVFINILNNSRDELIKIESDEKFILIDVFEKNEKIFITIRDNAGGIKEDIIEKLFEPYFTTKHKSQGTGIGLYMSEEIIVKHLKGQIKIANTKFTHNDIEYKGAITTITLNKID